MLTRRCANRVPTVRFDPPTRQRSCCAPRCALVGSTVTRWKLSSVQPATACGDVARGLPGSRPARSRYFGCWRVDYPPNRSPSASRFRRRPRATTSSTSTERSKLPIARQRVFSPCSTGCFQRRTRKQAPRAEKRPKQRKDEANSSCNGHRPGLGSNRPIESTPEKVLLVRPAITGGFVEGVAHGFLSSPHSPHVPRQD